MELAEEVYVLIRFLPKEEQFSLSDQMRRAAVSVPSNIAEGHGRQTDRELKHFLSIAKGSVFELETQIHLCLRLGYFTQGQAQKALSLVEEVSKILTSLILKTKI